MAEYEKKVREVLKEHGCFRWSVEDEGYVTSVPDLPSCMAFGETKESAIQNTKDAIAAWIKVARSCGRAVPSLSSVVVA